MNVPVKRLKAFTIFELIITMTVTSILIAVIISMFFRFNEFLAIRKVQIENNSELLLFMQELSDDFEKANEIYYKNNDLVLTINKNVKYKYVFTNETVKKSIGSNVKIFNIPVDNVEIEEYSKQNNLITEVKIYFNENLLPQPHFYLKKEYPKGVIFAKSD